MSWWEKANTEQKLAQLDSGIGLGMTAAAVAIASGTTVSAVQQFAYNHERRFRPSTGYSASHRRYNGMRRTRKAYLDGERMDLWGTGDVPAGLLDEVDA